MGSETATSSRLRAEIQAEQAHVDRAYARVDELAGRAQQVSTEAIETSKGITHQRQLEREAAAVHSARRLQAMKLGDYTQLCFGRIDTLTGERFYVGRFGVSDESDDPLVVDWRAPVAEPFYRATGSEPMGITLRRHFLSKGRTIVGLDDEILGRDGASDDVVLAGEAALLSALGRARTGRMGDIVATIQGEQDRVIRAPLAGALVVQGGPGTGKTAVALHRAAYLLYSYRFPLERARVLFIGPNATFLRYIEQVLPSLGEDSVVLETPATLVPDVAVTGVDPPAAAVVKADPRMAAVIQKAVRDRGRRLARDTEIPYGAYTLTLDRPTSGKVVATARRRDGSHNAKRAVVERLVAGHLLREYRAALARDVRIGRRGPEVEVINDDEFMEAIVRDRAVRRALDRMWPVLTPERLLRDLFNSRALLASAAGGTLTEAEWTVLYRDRAADGTSEPWTEHDVALLDEAANHLGKPHARRARRAREPIDDDAFGIMVDRVLDGFTPRCPECESELTRVGRRWRCDPCERADPDSGAMYNSEQVLAPEAQILFNEVRDTVMYHGQADEETEVGTTFGHILVDEAQDLSAMQWRMLARRCPSGSLTIVGDLGQASKPWAPGSWREVLSYLGRDDARREPVIAELTVNYRTPSEVMDVAAAVLAADGQGLLPPRSVRSVGVMPRGVPARTENLVATLHTVVHEELSAVDDGKVAVVVPQGSVEHTRHELHAAGNLEDAVVVLPLDEAKGLEFDSVVLVEPGAIVAETEHGLRSLYVALTRTTTRLAIVHTEPLPEALASSF